MEEGCTEQTVPWSPEHLGWEWVRMCRERKTSASALGSREWGSTLSDFVGPRTPKAGFPKWLHSLFLLFFGGEMLRTSWKGMRTWDMRDGTSGPFTWAPEQCIFLHQCWVEFSHYPEHQDPAHLCPDLCQQLLATSQRHKCQDWPGREQSFFSLQTTRVIARVWASSLWKGTWTGPRA